MFQSPIFKLCPNPIKASLQRKTKTRNLYICNQLDKYNEYQQYFGIFTTHLGPVVQLDRMADFGSAGCRFESCQGHNLFKHCIMKKILIFLFLLPITFFAQNNYSLSFDGVDDYVNLSNCSEDFVFESGFNISFWGKTMIDQNSESFIYFRNNNLPNNPIIYVRHSVSDTNEDEINVRGTSGFVSQSISIPEQTWFHFSLNLDRTSGLDVLKCYLNGNEVFEILDLDLGVLDFSDCSPITNYLNNGVFVGTAPQVDWDYFNGQIDDVQIWSTSKSQEEIQEYMNCPPLGNEDGLVGFWNFEEGAGGTALDMSSNENNGTIYSATYNDLTPTQNCQQCIDINEIDLGDDIATCDESVALDAGEGYDSYLWSTGETTQAINVTVTGDYTVTRTNQYGCESQSEVFIEFLDNCGDFLHELNKVVVFNKTRPLLLFE